MAVSFNTRSWTRRLAPLLFFGYWLGLLACDQTPDNAALLARVGAVEISGDELLAFEAALKSKGGKKEDRRSLLKTLVDRQILLFEAGGLGLVEDAETLRRLAQSETRALAEAMLRRQVAEQTEVQPEEIEKAHAAGWDSQLVAQEIYVSTAKQARLLLEALQGGTDFAEAGIQFAVDPYLGVAAGKAKQVVYALYDSPQAVVEALAALQAGAITAPVPLYGGFIVAKLVERRKVALVDVEEGISQALLKEKKKQVRQSYLRHLKWDFGTDYHAEGMDLVVAASQGGTAASLVAEQRRLPVYSFEGFQMDVEEVLEAVRPSNEPWAEASADKVNKKLSESHFPNKIMAQDARRKGIDKTEAFLQWRQGALEDLVLVRLRQQVMAQMPAVSQADLEAFYQANKHRFKSAAWARLQEVLVRDPAQARRLAEDIGRGETMGPLVQAHSTRLKTKEEDGVFYVSQSQVLYFGEAWMKAVMNTPLNRVHGPVETRGEYSVFKVLERHPESYHTLEVNRVRQAVNRDVLEHRQRDHFNAYLEGLKQKHAAQIEVFEGHLQYLQETATSVDRT
ncbi:MAG: hypothetical protein GKR89_16570 [Candidatus Latescibacteria bacterium]|nr:hypothetical protein [Candidatus Latescibacterota bacterium]